MGCPLRKIFGTILEGDEGRTPINGFENKKTNADTKGLTSCQEKGGKGHASTEDNVDTSIQRLEDLNKKELRKTIYSDQKQH